MAERNLKKEIRDRKARLKEIVNFISEIVEKCGKQTFQETVGYDSHTHTVRTFEIGDLCFIVNTGQRTIGGTTVAILMQKKFRIFEIHYSTAAFDLDNAEVKSFDSAPTSWEEFNKLLAKGVRKICREIDAQRRRERRAEELETQANREAEILEREARRLGIRI